MKKNYEVPELAVICIENVITESTENWDSEKVNA